MKAQPGAGEMLAGLVTEDGLQGGATGRGHFKEQARSGDWQENTFEMNVGKVSFVVEAKNLERGKESVEEKLKNIMIKDLIAKDNAMVS